MAESSESNVIRLNVHIARDEHPDLFDELIKFGKGGKRIQRLKTLASERLLLAGRLTLATAVAPQPSGLPDASPMPDGEALAAVNELCLPPIQQ
jgi:hypothetical protein